PLAGNAIGALRAKTEALDLDHCTPLWAGQNVSGCRETPAAELTRELVSGWRDLREPSNGACASSVRFAEPVQKQTMRSCSISVWKCAATASPEISALSSTAAA